MGKLKFFFQTKKSISYINQKISTIKINANILFFIILNSFIFFIKKKTDHFFFFLKINEF
jgi:hypothetical protein